VVQRLGTLAGGADEDLELPTYSARPLGRSARSMASSFGDAGTALTTRAEGGRGAAAKSSVWMAIQ
jgi:hypothetical protein